MLTAAGGVGQLSGETAQPTGRQKWYHLVDTYICGPGEPCCPSAYVTCQDKCRLFSRQKACLWFKETLGGARGQSHCGGLTSSGFLLHCCYLLGLHGKTAGESRPYRGSGAEELLQV